MTDSQKAYLAPAVYIGIIGLLLTATIFLGRQTDSTIKSLDEKVEDHRGLDIHPKAGAWVERNSTDIEWLKKAVDSNSDSIQKLRDYQWQMLKDAKWGQ